MILREMSDEDLINLAKEASLLLEERKKEWRSEIAKIKQLAALADSFSSSTKILPKYRNPNNPAQTWTGRGKTPRWLADAISSGLELDAFIASHSSNAA